MAAESLLARTSPFTLHLVHYSTLVPTQQADQLTAAEAHNASVCWYRAPARGQAADLGLEAGWNLGRVAFQASQHAKQGTFCATGTMHAVATTICASSFTLIRSSAI